MTAPARQSVELRPGLVLMATVDRAVIAPAGDLPPDLEPAPGSPEALALTRRLLDGAVGLAVRQAPGGAAPALTVDRWVWRLAGLYQLTHRTPALMAEARDRLLAAGRPALAAWADEKAREERGHDRLALMDLAALGLDAAAVVERVVPPAAAALLERFTSFVRREDPVEAAGYAYALERLAMSVDEAEIARVEAVLPPGVRATRCLRVHSSVGSDAGHVDENVEAVARLDAPARARVARAAFEAALLAVVPAAAPMEDAALARLLDGLRAVPGAA